MSEEAAKLFSALQGWAGTSEAGRAAGTAGSLTESLRSVGDHLGGGEECRYCPICRAIEAFRGVSPEAREHLAVAVESLAQALTVIVRQSEPSHEARRPRDTPTKVRLDGDDEES